MDLVPTISLFSTLSPNCHARSSSPLTTLASFEIVDPLPHGLLSILVSLLDY